MKRSGMSVGLMGVLGDISLSDLTANEIKPDSLVLGAKQAYEAPTFCKLCEIFVTHNYNHHSSILKDFELLKLCIFSSFLFQ
jgi:hypothetical protein